MTLYGLRCKLILSIALMLSLTACFNGGGDGNGEGGGFKVKEIILPTLTQLPTFSSIIGTTATVTSSGLDARYYYLPYVSTSDFTDVADATELGGSVDFSTGIKTFIFPLENLGITELNQDYILYVKWITFGRNGETPSALSEATQIKLLAPPVDITNVSAVGSSVTVEWLVEAGKSYNIYYAPNNSISEYTLGTSNKLVGAPFVSGKESFSLSDCLYCTVAITTVEGNSESIPVSLTTGFRLSDNVVSFSLKNKTGDSVTAFINGTPLPNIRVYYSTTMNPLPENSTLLYDGLATSGGDVVHNIQQHYNAVTGLPLTYYYIAEGYSTIEYIDSSGSVKNFVTTTPLSQSLSYTAINSDFAVKIGSTNVAALYGQQKVGTSLFWATGYSAHEYPLDGSGATSYSINVGATTKAFVVDPADATTHYTLANRSVNKFVAGVKVDSLVLNSVSGEQDVDMVQTSTDLYVLTSKRILRIAKANVSSTGTFMELSTGLFNTRDIEIDETNAILYMADVNSIISLPIAGGASSVISTTGATFIALDSTGENLYALERGLNQSIRKIDLSMGNETEIQQSVSINDQSIGLLKVYGNWLYFSADTGTYRYSLVNSSVDTVSSLSATGVFVDGAEPQAFVIANNSIYIFPEDYYYPLMAAPTDVGTITTTPGDSVVDLVITEPTGSQIDFYTVNGNEFPSNGGIAATVSNLANSQLSNIEVIAYNLAGASTPVNVQATPIINTPSIAITNGALSGFLNLGVTWANPIQRDITLNIYRSQTALVDTSGTPISSVDYVDGVDLQSNVGTSSSTYSDLNLADGTLFYYSATINDGTGEGAGSAVIGRVPYTPFFISATAGSGPTTANSIDNYNAKEYWAHALGIKEMKSNGNLALADIGGKLMGVGSVELVADSFDGSLYVTKNNSSEIFKIEPDVTVNWIETSYANAGFTLDHITIDGSSLYAAGSGRVIAVSLIGGAITDLYTSTSAIGKIAQNGAYVYWIEGKSIKRVFKAGGGTVETLISAVNDIKDMEVDASGNVYYSMLSSTSAFYFMIKKYEVATMITSVITDSGLTAGFTIDSNFVYAFLRKLPMPGVEYQQFAKYALADGAETIVAPGMPIGLISDLYASGGTVYSMSINQTMFKIQ